MATAINYRIGPNGTAIATVRSRLLDNELKMLRRIIGEDIDLSFHAAADVCPVFADAGQMEQVVMNLAVNSRDAMAAGGKLLIETRNVTLDDVFGREHLWARPGNVSERNP